MPKVDRNERTVTESDHVLDLARTSGLPLVPGAALSTVHPAVWPVALLQYA